MALDATVIRRVMRDYADKAYTPGTPADLTKPDIIAAVQGIDAYLDANAAAMNQAIPQPARGVLTAPQKAHLFAAVALARWSG